jgi:4-hydroxy-3-methylbut-2-en-1-yl diphosphate reductase
VWARPASTLGYATGVNQLTLIAPRGYCAGVDRAIETVERALQEHGAPIYVRGEIVHNKHVVADLAQKGAVFVDEPEQVPSGAMIILSAHGSAPEIYARCRARGLTVIDATCPLVSKVHAEVRRYAGKGATVLLVGHPEHDEVIGTRGEAPERVIVVEDVAAAERVEVEDPDNVALTTQTTLSLDDTAAIVAVLRRRFPALQAPASSDICYATQNRQDAVKAAVVDDRAELVLVVGSQNSSNSQRLVDVARAGGADAYLIDSQTDLRVEWLDGHGRVALTAGASAPEALVQGVADWLAERGWQRGGEEVPSTEGVVFALPAELRPQ